jgi:hypothetical protein
VADAWMPGVRRIRAGTDGGPLQGGAPRVVWVTLGVNPGTLSVISAAQQLSLENRPCHLVWDPLTGDLAQLLPVVRAGCVLGTPECLKDAPRCLARRAARINRQGRLCVQIAVLGSERKPFTNYPMVRLQDILGWLDSWQIPRRWPAGPPAPNREATRPRSQALWACGGHYGASQVPECDHVGPGGIDIDRLACANTAVEIRHQRPAPAAIRLGQRRSPRQLSYPAAARPALDPMDLDPPGPDMNLPSSDLCRRGGAAAAADDPTERLVRQLQAARSHAEQTIADSRQLAGNLAATEHKMAVTLLQIAARRKASNQLRTLSQSTRMQAVHRRDQASSASLEGYPARLRR